MSGAELHAHTTASDGTLPPQQVVDLAAELDLEVLAITDHDTMAGVPEAELQAADLPLEVIPGVEISCASEGAAVHLLAYWPDPSHPALARELGEIRESRRVRVVRMVERLEEIGFAIPLDRVLELGGDNPGRRHVAQVLVEQGLIGSIGDAFTPGLIATSGGAYVPKYTLEPVYAVDLVVSSGGVPVLAHPGISRAGGPLDERLIESMTAAGLVGLEARHISHSPAEEEAYGAIGRRLGLVITAGSDCHGDPVQMGRRRASMETVEELRSRANI